MPIKTRVRNSSGEKKSKKTLPPEIEKLRNTKKWKDYYNTLKPRNPDGSHKPFKREGSSAQGFTKEEFERHIDKLVLSKVNHRDPMKSFDDFLINFKSSNKK